MSWLVLTVLTVLMVIAALAVPYLWWAVGGNALLGLLVAPPTWRYLSWPRLCRVGEWWLDLHNAATFLEYTFRTEGVLSLTWYHHQPSIGPPTPNLVVLEFADVRGFHVEQASDWDVRCAVDTLGWDYWSDREGRAALSFAVADSALSFTASGVRLRLVPTDDALAQLRVRPEERDRHDHTPGR